MWDEGDTALLRGVYEGRPVYVQSVRVIRDSAVETVLAIWPGAECAAPAHYLDRKHAKTDPWNRWHETLTNTLELRKYLWHTNRFLIILEPERYFSTIYIWNAALNEFVCYYINFQLPFKRTRFGFDTLDMDLDIIIEADYQWQWKDVDEYQQAIQLGGIRPEWANAVEQARKEVAARLEGRLYPLDGSWLTWKPDPSWQPPGLPADWDSTD